MQISHSYRRPWQWARTTENAEADIGRKESRMDSLRLAIIEPDSDPGSVLHAC